MLNEALAELLGRRVRLWIYVFASTVLLMLTAWQAAQGNWVEACVSFLTSFVPGLAAANVPDGREIPGPVGAPGRDGHVSEVVLRELVWEALSEYLETNNPDKALLVVEDEDGLPEHDFPEV